jgi:hypothetical protein
MYQEDGDESAKVRMRDAEELRLTLEEYLLSLEADVESRRAQSQSLALYAQMLLAKQVSLLTWLLILLTAAGVAGAFAR